MRFPRANSPAGILLLAAVIALGVAGTYLGVRVIREMDYEIRKQQLGHDPDKFPLPEESGN